MTQEDKELLVKDLCARLPYGVKAKVLDESVLQYDYTAEEGGVINGIENLNDGLFVIKCKEDGYVLSYDEFKPYLRPMSSMTDYEAIEWHKTTFGQRWIAEDNIERCIDWLNAHHFDFRGLIEKGLALDATGKKIY